MVKESNIAVYVLVGYVLLHAQCGEVNERKKAFTGGWDTYL